MKAFVSYVSKDGPKAHEFISILKNIGYEVSNSLDSKITKGSLTKNSFLDSINDEIRSSDLQVILSSSNYENTQTAQSQSHAMRLHSDITGDSLVVVVNLSETQLPSVYWQYKVVHANRDYAGGLSYFKRVVQEHFNAKHEVEIADDSEQSAVDSHLSELRKAFLSRSLVIVCGAGVSIDAGLPDWSSLLDSLLAGIVDQLSPEAESPAEDTSEIQAFKSSSSALIIGRYLKSMLKDNFLPTVRDTLYCDVEGKSEIINAIVELAAPSRTGATLDSIITYNFDGLIEEVLGNRSISHQAVFSEGQRCSPDEIGIYHVHGYLPRKGKIQKDVSIVFSEDAYHDQFTDPFSWANLIQLAKFGQSTCLFVGLSLTDPNLRRLLDVSNRRDPQQARRHFIIQADDDRGSKSRLVESMKSSDAAELGLTSIRLEGFREIAPFLRKISAN